MKCGSCGAENRSAARFCSECGKPMGGSKAKERPAAEARPDMSGEFWRPDWKWHAKTLAIIYLILAVVYAALTQFLSKVPEPYRMRDIPKEMTPWLKK